VLSHDQTNIHLDFGYRIISEIPGEDRFVYIRDAEESADDLRYDLVLNWATTVGEGAAR
jgi:hypothetical protein